jgi:hypothetical protein
MEYRFPFPAERLRNGSVTNVKIADGTIAKAKLAANTILIEEQIPVLTDEKAGLAADSTGVKYTAPYKFLISSDLLSCAKAVYIEADIEASNADSVTAVELYDTTAGVVRGSASGNSGDRIRSSDLKASLVAGNEHTVRINVTTASATAGATTGVRAVRLITSLGVS